MSDLKDDLTEISGVGDATADKILDVLKEADTTPDAPLLRRAREAAAAGNDREAAVYLRRYAGD